MPRTALADRAISATPAFDDRRERVCVIGAGSSGIAMCRSLALRDIPYDCVEARSEIGGLWRYPTGGASCAYASLHANTSKTVMQYPSHPMPDDFPHYPHHSLVASYLEAVTASFGLHAHLELERPVDSVAPAGDGTWWVRCAGVSPRRYRAVAVASGGRHAEPVYARFAGTFGGRQLHVADYDGPEPFRGERVVVVGLGASSADVASEVSAVAARTWLAVRTGHYVVPKLVQGHPVDRLSPPLTLLSVEARRPLLRLMLAIVHGPMRAHGLPAPPYKPGAGPLIATSSLLPAIAHGLIRPTGAIVRADDRDIFFADGSSAQADAIIHATGYEIAFPFLDTAIARGGGDAPPLYRQVASPELEGLFFIGLVHSMMALPPVAEHQAEWVAEILDGTVALPSRGEMWKAIRHARRRQDRRFHDSSGHMLVDPIEYERLLRRERRVRRCAPAR